METLTTNNILGTSIRGVYQGNMAYLALEKVEDEKMGEVLDSLKEQAQTITSTDLAKIRKPEKYEMVKNTHHWVEPSMEEIKACLESLEKKLLAYDSRIIQVASLGWEQSSQTREIINSYGMQEKDADCVQYLVASVVVKENDIVMDDYEIEVRI